MLLVVTVVTACGDRPVATVVATPSEAELVATFEIVGTWERCHQMGACAYHLELAARHGTATADLEQAGAQFETGPLIPGPGFPSRLAAGPHTLTLVSTMLGDTIEPNGSQTVLGEEARCEAEFVVGPERSRITATVAFTPGACTIEIQMKEPT
jgi:hypothetical protein